MTTRLGSGLQGASPGDYRRSDLSESTLVTLVALKPRTVVLRTHRYVEEVAMLWDASVVKGYGIEAHGGRLGTVSDFLFEDAKWMIRWLVVDTGHWLSGRKVLLPPSALGHPDPQSRRFPVKLTMQQVKDSPAIDTDRPVSRQMESHVYDYYGWVPYWIVAPLYVPGSKPLEQVG